MLAEKSDRRSDRRTTPPEMRLVTYVEQLHSIARHAGVAKSLVCTLARFGRR